MDALVPGTVSIIDSAGDCPEISIIDGPGNAKVVLWPGNGGRFRSLHVIRLEAGSATVTLRHPNDCVYYVAEGSGAVVDLADGTRSTIAEGAMVHIDKGDGYRLEAGADGGMTVLGGPCPADPALYAAFESR